MSQMSPLLRKELLAYMQIIKAQLEVARASLDALRLQEKALIRLIAAEDAGELPERGG